MLSICRKRLSLLFCVASLLSLTPAAHAIQVMEFRAETLLLNSETLRANLNLTPNQLKLWQQTEGRLNGILHQREIRRGHMQSDVEAALAKQGLELRDLTGRVAQEEQVTIEENQQIREACLILNDALDDQQRSQVQAFLLEQMLARPDVKKDAASSDSARKSPGTGRGRGGMGGSSGGTKF